MAHGHAAPAAAEAAPARASGTRRLDPALLPAAPEPELLRKLRRGPGAEPEPEQLGGGRAEGAGGGGHPKVEEVFEVFEVRLGLYPIVAVQLNHFIPGSLS